MTCNTDHTYRLDEETAPFAAIPVQAGTALPLELTSFVGREQVVADALTRIGTARLVTLVGPAGVGKTRVLTRVAHDLTAFYRHGVLAVRVGEVAPDETALAAAIAARLTLRADPGATLVDTLIAHLRDRDLLLMLDGCEHLVDAGGSGPAQRLISTLRAEAPLLRVAATSRTRLAIPGEQVVTVPPLCPDAGAQEAVQLLRERAAGIGVEIPDRDLDTARTLCDRLGGLPLAIELAAARLDTMTLQEMIEYPDVLELLSDGPSGPHRSMREALDRSRDLLPAPQRHMWALLAGHESWFTLAEVRDVCGAHGLDPAAAPAMTAELVRASLLLADTTGDRTRYRMLGPVRHYGLSLAEVCDPGAKPLTMLSSRELVVAAKVAQGMSNREIGCALGISHRTVEAHLGRVYSKLDTTNRFALARWYLLHTGSR